MIVEDDQRRALDFVAAANRGGYKPTGPEINQWRMRPRPKPGKPGALIEPAKPAVSAAVARNYGLLAGFDSVSRTLRELSDQHRRQLEILTGVGLSQTGTPARYAPDGPPEKFLKQNRPGFCRG